jgi:hypothetical protein
VWVNVRENATDLSASDLVRGAVCIVLKALDLEYLILARSPYILFKANVIQTGGSRQ